MAASRRVCRPNPPLQPPLPASTHYENRRKIMSKNSSRTIGRHFLNIPGPTPLPDRVLRAMDMPIIDHRGPEFARLSRRVLDGLKTLSPGDRILMYETGQFATLWKKMAVKLGINAEFIESDWRSGADPNAIE